MIEVANQKVIAGEPLTEAETELVSLKETMSLRSSEEDIQWQIQGKTSGYLAAFMVNLQLSFEAQVVDLFQFLFWDALGMMLLGMALYKMGVFNAELSFRAYWIMMILGFGIGLGVNTYEMFYSVANGYQVTFTMPTYNIGRIATAFGYVGLFMLICKSAILPWLRRALSDVGKMALTNYLTQSVLCLVIFIFFGMFSKLRLHELYYVVIAIWAFQIAFSHYWLKNFKYGPIEWVLAVSDLQSCGE